MISILHHYTAHSCFLKAHHSHTQDDREVKVKAHIRRFQTRTQTTSLHMLRGEMKYGLCCKTSAGTVTCSSLRLATVCSLSDGGRKIEGGR